ncbi:hypothetical protein CHS0354_001630 [Potamilus streckersoni]|uniref:Uncharacterized protein n=1 Tax=Potamilus streckersoni TaxID=2493646 RepID=A0AAE0SFW1_9BIVA|nr:hypothetical protein CHS0354_001630 [Potamilus streckersoni]
MTVRMSSSSSIPRDNRTFVILNLDFNDNRIFINYMPSLNLDWDRDIYRTNSAITSICKFLKNCRHAYVVYHRLDEGDKCSFTSDIQYDIIHEYPARNGAKRDMKNGIWHTSFFREMKELEKSCYAVKSQQVKFINNMTKYLHQAPRKYVGATSLAMDTYWSSSPAAQPNETDQEILDGTKKDTQKKRGSEKIKARKRICQRINVSREPDREMRSNFCKK